MSRNASSSDPDSTSGVYRRNNANNAAFAARYAAGVDDYAIRVMDVS